MLMVEQNVRLAVGIADRYVVLRDGRVIVEGPVRALEGSYEELVRRISL
jgi:ABC-type branched-subunit amino acid transport system ATPase component